MYALTEPQGTYKFLILSEEKVELSIGNGFGFKSTIFFNPEQLENASNSIKVTEEGIVNVASKS